MRASFQVAPAAMASPHVYCEGIGMMIVLVRENLAGSRAVHERSIAAGCVGSCPESVRIEVTVYYVGNVGQAPSLRYMRLCAGL